LLDVPLVPVTLLVPVVEEVVDVADAELALSPDCVPFVGPAPW